MSDWFADALATRKLERVEPNMGAAGERINDSRKHVRSARLLADDDTTLAMAACHDAIRKAFAAHMSANDVRVRSGDGSHRITIEYARHMVPAIEARPAPGSSINIGQQPDQAAPPVAETVENTTRMNIRPPTLRFTHANCLPKLA